VILKVGGYKAFEGLPVCFHLFSFPLAYECGHWGEKGNSIVSKERITYVILKVGEANFQKAGLTALVFFYTWAL
jgi:hypothetical protein